MKCWLNKSRIVFAIGLAAVLLLGTGIPLQAAPPETGTLKIHLKENKYCVEFAVYRVADYVNGNYELTNEFAGINEGGQKWDVVNLNAMSDAASAEEYAQRFAEWEEENHLQPMLQAYTQDGTWNAGEVPAGMYLTVQIRHEGDSLKVAPFLLGVPYWKVETIDGKEVRTLEYNVESQPKGEEDIPVPEKPEEPEKPEKPQKPEPPDEVKTGDESQEWIRFYAILCIAAGGTAFAAARQKKERRK